MGKHSIEKEKTKINFKKKILAILIIVALVFGINFILSHRDIQEENDTKTTGVKTAKTIEGEKLVIKSSSEYNRIVEYTFENNNLKTVKMYEQFEEKEKFEQSKKTYEIIEGIEIINVNEQELSVEIEKKDFGSDAEKSYEEIYDKYLVQIIGAYEIIQ